MQQEWLAGTFNNTEALTSPGSIVVRRNVDDEYLTLYIRKLKYDPGIMEAIESVRAKYDEDLSHVPGWLLVTTDFQPPR